MAKLNSILHQELRLAIVSFLATAEWVDFKKLIEVTEATKGNLSVQISKLEKAGYMEVTKTCSHNYPLTECKLKSKGKEELDAYIADLNKMLTI